MISHLVSLIFNNFQCLDTRIIITTYLPAFYINKFHPYITFSFSIKLFLFHEISLKIPHWHIDLHTISYHSCTIISPQCPHKDPMIVVWTTKTKTSIMIQFDLLTHLPNLTLKKDLEDKEKYHFMAHYLINKLFLHMEECSC